MARSFSDGWSGRATAYAGLRCGWSGRATAYASLRYVDTIRVPMPRDAARPRAMDVIGRSDSFRCRLRSSWLGRSWTDGVVGLRPMPVSVTSTRSVLCTHGNTLLDFQSHVRCTSTVPGYTTAVPRICRATTLHPLCYSETTQPNSAKLVLKQPITLHSP